MESIVSYILHDVPLWYILAPTAVILLYWYLTKDFNMFAKYGFTGPKPYPLIGTAANLFKKGLLVADVELCRKYRGKRVISTFEFGFPGVMIIDPYLVKTILVKEFSHFVNRKDMKSAAPPFDRSLIAIRDDHWRHVRNTVSPTFSGAKLKMMTPLIQKCAQSLVEVLETKAKAGEAVDASSLFGYFTMDVIGSTMFGLDVDSLKNPDHPFVKHATNLIQPSGIKIKLIIFLFVVMPKLLKLMTRLGIEFNRSDLDYFSESMKQTLKDRREQTGNYHDFVALMTKHEVDESKATLVSSDGIKWTNEGLTQDDILSQMAIFFFAGFDTTSNSLVFVVYNMCLYPDLQRRLQEEVDDLLDGQEPNYENVQKLVYLEMFINETLRLYGPGTRAVREADVDIDIDGITIPKGVAVWLPFGAYHRDPEIWPEPETFDPERFSPEQKSQRDPSLYMPFGQGPRNCVGLRLAVLEVKIGLVKILQKCTLTLTDDTPREIEMSKFQAKPAKPVKIKVAMRSS